MFEYELIQQRNAELQRLAHRDRLVREARSAGRADNRPGVLRRLARSVRPGSGGYRTAEPRPARLGEC